MGIYSRSWIQRDDSLKGRIVFCIIGVTIAVYVIQGILLGRGEVNLAEIFGVVPSRMIGRGWLWQLFTHVLLHEPYAIWHLAFNMIFLYWLGVDIAEIYGVRRFLVLYLGGAAGCALAFAAIGYAIGKTTIPAIGASGAIMAVSVVAAFYFPTRTVMFMYVLPMPLWMLVTLYVGLDLYYPLAGLRDWLSSAGHLGGALFGFLFYRFQLDVPTPAVLRRLFTSSGPDKREVDRILGKISADGMHTLTDRERETLKRASRG